MKPPTQKDISPDTIRIEEIAAFVPNVKGVKGTINSPP
jgi:hypothetical protein